jgi:transposase
VLSETRKYGKFTAQQKTEIMLASLRGPKTMAELCREHDIADNLLRTWREQFLTVGAERLRGKTERTETDEMRKLISRLERALGRKTMEVEVAGKPCGDGSEHARRPFPRDRSRKATPPQSSPGSPAYRAKRFIVGRPAAEGSAPAGGRRRPHGARGRA